MSEVLESMAGEPDRFQVSAEFPLSATQKRFWFLDRLNPGDSTLNVALQWEVRGRFRARNFERAFQTVIDRHEVLRTRYVERDGEPVQQVVANARFKLAVFDLQAMKGEPRDARLVDITKEETTRSFDLTTPHPIRVALVQVEPQRAVILLTVHHICFDGWSDGILGREIGEAVAAFENDRVPSFPELPLQFGDYALWQRECLDGDATADDEAFWRRTLADASYFEVAPDFPRPETGTISSAYHAFDLPAPLCAHMDAEARRRGISPYAYGAAALSAVLHAATGQRDVILCTQVAGREEADLDPLVGAFINNVALRFDIAPDTSVERHLAQAQTVLQDALAHQSLPFNRVVELLQHPRDPFRAPVTSVGFIQQRWFFDHQSYGSFELVSVPSRPLGSIYDLQFVLIGRRGGWRMTVEYNPDVFRLETVRDLMDRWQSALGAFSEGNGARRLTEVVGGAAQEKDDANPRAAPADRATASAPEPVAAIGSGAEADDLERTIAAVWSEALGVSPIGRDQNFFELGGHSMLAVRVLAMLRKRLRTEISIATLYKAPTVAKLAERLTSAVVRPETAPVAVTGDRRIIELHEPVGDAVPLIAINNAAMLYALSTHFKTPRHCVCIRPLDLDQSVDTGAEDFNAIADEYVALVRQVKPEGPYALFGNCVHGNLAIEVARRLTAEGKEVVGLFVKDVWEPRYAERLQRNRSLRFRNKVHDFRMRLVRLHRGETGVFGFLRMYRLAHATGLLTLMLRIGLVKSGASDISAAVDALIRHLTKARNRYVPDPFDGDVTMFVTRDTPIGRGFDAALGWKSVVRGDLRLEPIRDMAVYGDVELGMDEAAAVIERQLLRFERARASSRG